MSTLTLNDLDWVYTKSGGRLHFALLTPEQDEELNEYASVEKATLGCGRVADVSIPGPLSRMGMIRCRRCCHERGYPTGIGSPKNDPAIRSLLGLPVS